MIKNNLSQRHFLEQNNKVNNLFEHLLQQMRTLGYPETRLWINVARQSFEHELFEQIKKTLTCKLTAEDRAFALYMAKDLKIV